MCLLGEGVGITGQQWKNRVRGQHQLCLFLVLSWGRRIPGSDFEDWVYSHNGDGYIRPS